jgi:hypothetical protein
VEVLGTAKVQNCCFVDSLKSSVMVDMLEKRGWENCGLCKLCNEVQESSAHIFFHCRFTIRVWSILKYYLGLHGIDTRDWHDIVIIKEWWVQVIHSRG